MYFSEESRKILIYNRHVKNVRLFWKNLKDVYKRTTSYRHLFSDACIIRINVRKFISQDT